MWFFIIAVLVLVAIVVAGAVSDVRRRARRRRLGDDSPGRGVDAAAGAARTGFDVRAGESGRILPSAGGVIPGGQAGPSS